MARRLSPLEETNVTKLRKHAAAIALAGLLALFGTACASDSGGTEEGVTEPAAAPTELAT